MPEARNNTKVDGFPPIEEAPVSAWTYAGVLAFAWLAGMLTALWLRGRRSHGAGASATQRFPPVHIRPPFFVEYALTLVGAYLMGVLSIVSVDHVGDVVAVIHFGSLVAHTVLATAGR